MRRAWLLWVLLALVGCEPEDKAADESLSVKLDLELRDEAELQVERRGDAVEIDLGISKGFGVAEDGATLRGDGRLERFPEADVVLYTARFSVAPVAGGPCGNEPVSLALSLHRRGDAARLSGSLTPYCGKDVWFGTPARTPLRLSAPAASEE